MKGILIKQKQGHKMDGRGESLGKDFEGKFYTFWNFAGHMEIPIELAIQLEKEIPQRFEIVDRELAKKLIGEIPNLILITKPEIPKPIPVIIQPKKEAIITLKELKEKTKDEINDWAAKRDYDVNTKHNKAPMIKELCKQIEKRTGQVVR